MRNFSRILTVAAAVMLAGAAWGAAEVMRPPDFTMQFTTGQSARLSNFRERTVVLAFFQDGCQTCRNQVPELNAVARSYADRLTVIGVGLNFTDQELLAQDARHWGMIYPVFGDYSRNVMKYFQISKVPTIVIISASGFAIDKIVGSDSKTITQHVDAVLAKMGASNWPPTVACKPLVNNSGTARAEDIGSKVTGQIHDGLKSKGIRVDKPLPRCDLIIDGNVTKAGSEVGVDLYIRSPAMQPLIHINERIDEKELAKLTDIIYGQLGVIYGKR